MFEHFKKFFANERNRTMIALVIGFLIFLGILRHFGLYEEGFKGERCDGEKTCPRANASKTQPTAFMLS